MVRPMIACWHDSARGDGLLGALESVPDSAAARDPQYWRDRLPVGARYRVDLYPQGMSTARGLASRIPLYEGSAHALEVPAAPDVVQAAPAQLLVRIGAELVLAVIVDGVVELVSRSARVTA